MASERCLPSVPSPPKPDLDGILEVTAREKVSGLQRSISIGDAIARFEQDKLDAARSRVQALFGEGGEAGSVAAAGAAGPAASAPGVDARRLAVEARALVEKAERMLEKAGAQDTEDLVDAMELVRRAEAQARQRLVRALHAMAQGDAHQARVLAQASLRLAHSPLAARVLRVLGPA